MSHKLRLGVDVGGTFTKAVAVQTQPYSLITQAIVPTTHDAPEGVARGIIQVLSALLEHPDVPAERIALVAHSTTQAVNALLEGDTAHVGIVGMGRGRDVGDAARFTHVGNIPLAPGKFLYTSHVFIDTSVDLTREHAEQAIEALLAQGVQAIVASEAFSVDDPTNELLILDVAAERGLPAVGGHQLTGIYGLEVRTLTAAINASLLPKMLQTAELVEQSLSSAGVNASLMVMRGDGGLTDLATLRRRPILTLLSGPAASLAGALLSGNVANGIFLEVGGTSSNIGLVHGGQPQLAYVRVMEHPTCVRSLDVRVQGIAGGSMLRIRKNRIVDVGPRSAHIASLDYVSLSPQIESETDLSLELIAPRDGDPQDYAVIRSDSGQHYALTVTCAANALGLVPQQAYAYGSQSTALKGFTLLGNALGISPQKAAQQVIDLAARQIADAIEALASEYHLPKRSYELIGGGGGAGALVPIVAARLGIPFRLVEHAEIISSLGDALASVREEIERAIGDGISAEALAKQAENAAIEAGAELGSVQVVVERDEERQTLRAIAMGHIALAAPFSTPEITEEQARLLAAKSAHVHEVQSLTLLADTSDFWVYDLPGRFLRRQQTIIMDRHGILRLQVSGAKVIVDTPERLLEALKELTGAYRASDMFRVRLLVGNHLLDLSNDTGTRDIFSSASSAINHMEPGKPVVAIIEK